MEKFKNSILLAGTISYLIVNTVIAGNLAKNFQDSVHKVKPYIHDTSNEVIIRLADQKECQMLLQALKRESANAIKKGKQHLNDSNIRNQLNTKDIDRTKLGANIKNSSSNNQFKNLKQTTKLITLTNNNKMTLKFKTFVIKPNSSLLFNISQISKKYGWKVISPGTEDITILLTKKIKATSYQFAIKNLIKGYPISVKLYKKNKVIKVVFTS